MKIYENGDSFKGRLVGDKKHGRGIYTFATGTQVKGKWKHDKRHGNFEISFPDGRILKAKWINDVAEEHGKLLKNGVWIDTISNEKGEWFITKEDERKTRPKVPQEELDKIWHEVEA